MMCIGEDDHIIIRSPREKNYSCKEYRALGPNDTPINAWVVTSEKKCKLVSHIVQQNFQMNGV